MSIALTAEKIAELVGEQQRQLDEQRRQLEAQQAQIDALQDVVEVLRREWEGRLRPTTVRAEPDPHSARSGGGTGLFPGAAADAAKKPGRRSEATIFCDGGCSNNPGPGGWACIVDQNGRRDEYSGGKQQTTNNQMELQALIEALKVVPSGVSVHIITDSEYLAKGVTSWIKSWARNGWMTAAKQPVKNREQWQELQLLLEDHPHKAEWVRGHSGHPENERCDQLAQEAIRRVTGSRK